MSLPVKLLKVRHATVLLFIIFQLIFLYKIQQYKTQNVTSSSDLKVYDQSKSSITYKTLLKNFSPKEFIRKPLSERCDDYFDELFKTDENWKISDLKGMGYSYDVFNKKNFYNDRYNNMKKEFEQQGRPISDIDTGKIFEELTLKIDMNEKIESLLIDNAGHLRIYGKCYTDESKQNHLRCLDIESRLFPFLTFEPPISERWDGTVVQDFLDISKYYQYDGMEVKHKKGSEFYTQDTYSDGESCYLRKIKSKMNGRGIVISIGDQFIDEIINLIKVLRFHENTLPIEFVHKGDLADASKKRIIELARSDIYIPKMGLLLDKYPQEVWFLDAKRCFVQTYYYDFSYFANKWVAVMFNSFEEMFLMDSDSVPFMKPDEFFGFLDGYKQTGCYFFKDRESGELLPNEYKNIFIKMLPTEIENTFFDIPVTTGHTLDNKFMAKNARHYMEAGIVLMNRKQHLLGILMAVHIQFWGPLNTYIYGEKEIFWLGQSIAGDEKYEFNLNPVGAIGKIVVNEPDHHIIGSHPAHMAPDNKTLLWVNSGMEICKKHTWEQDFRENEQIRKKFSTEEQVKEYYMSPLEIEGVIIPPDASRHFPNDKGWPTRGWANRRELGCKGYNWIAHLRTGTNHNDPESVGREIIFNLQQQDFYNKISQIWVYQYEFRKPESVSTNSVLTTSTALPGII